MSEQRPRLKVEKIQAGEMKQNFTFPHCDARILHAPEDCSTCALDEMKHLHEEREQLEVSYSGKANRSYPCPVDKARSAKNYNKWWGNAAHLDDA